MMAWQKQWRFLSDDDVWDDPDVDDRPGAYKLGIGGPRRGNITSVYIGYASNARAELLKHGKHQSGLRAKISAAYGRGQVLYCKVAYTDDAYEARQLKQDELDTRPYQYPWNQRKAIADTW